MNAAEFNALHPVGTPVFAYPGARPEDIPGARRLVTRTRTEAQTSASGDPVVWVDGEGAYICLTHVDPVSEVVYEAAKQAEQTATAVVAREEAKDRRRRIYVDGNGNGWIDLTVDTETGERDLVGLTDTWKIATPGEIRRKTGGLREIGRCW
ncbi:hypothetical protein [Streptomyces sp. NPDC008150]|uniref:hypothetical protein n=1 Tax=Streptomyces sp. NPDC008150 TaxID=3364816 RepID=UPI0036EFA34A